MKNHQHIGILLNDAADIIARHGHTKHVLHDMRGGYCALGALELAAEHNRLRWRDRHALVEARFALAEYVHGPVPHWNDEPSRTAAEVIATLRALAAIEAARRQHDADQARPAVPAQRQPELTT
jgi:hypothetical protein